MAAFIDTSIECAICLNALDNNLQTIILSCGHKWHLACLKEQLENAQPSRSKRLIFTGCRCAKCSAFCDHPELENLTRRTDALRERVDVLVAEQLKVDAANTWKDAVDDGVTKKRLIEEGRRSYAFYLCGGCDEPYFGGTVECADEMDGELTTSEDRLCQSCSPKSQVACQHAFQLGDFTYGNVDIVAIHQTMYAMVMCIFVLNVMREIHNESGREDMELNHQHWRAFRAEGRHAHFPSLKGVANTAMDHHLTVSRFTTVLHVSRLLLEMLL